MNVFFDLIRRKEIESYIERFQYQKVMQKPLYYRDMYVGFGGDKHTALRNALPKSKSVDFDKAIIGHDNQVANDGMLYAVVVSFPQ